MSFEDMYWMSKSSDPLSRQFARDKLRRLYPTREKLIEAYRKAFKKENQK